MTPVTGDRAIGDYYLNQRTGIVVEILDVDLSGTCRVLDIRQPLDAEPTQLTETQISSAPWRRLDRTT